MQTTLCLYYTNNTIREYVTYFWEMMSQTSCIDDMPLNLNIQIECILILTEENEYFTFDRSNRIIVIIPKDLIIHKLRNCHLFVEQLEFHGNNFLLKSPNIDLKLGFDEGSIDKLYANCILYVEDYEKINSTISVKDINFNYSDFPYIDKSFELMTQEFFKQNDLVNHILLKVKTQHKNFGYANPFEFFKENDYILLKGEAYPKRRKEVTIKEEDDRLTIEILTEIKL